ncbi:MAG: site-specific integrase [Proteobacteria bacterium]|nr:site-specific integrase [Pseudomonadota bacterium]
MGIQVECPECGHRNPEGEARCKGKLRYGEQKGERCDFSRLTKASGKIYWIEYRDHGKRKRERIGPSKAAAEARLLEVQRALVEDKHIERDKNAKVTLDQLFDWFLNLQEVKALDSYVRMTQQIKSLSRLTNTNQVVRDLTILQLEEYAVRRLQESSPTKRGQTIAPKTVKEELNLLRNILNRALRYEFISKIPVSRYPVIKIDNIRKRVFSEVEYQLLLEVCPLWLRRIVIMARGTGMRQGEILKLQWSDVDLKTGFVRLNASMTKTDEARLVRLLPEVIAMLNDTPRALHTQQVFLSATNKPIPYWTTYVQKTWKQSLEKAGIEGACFHDLRHDFVTRAMRNGNASHVVMKQVGHKSDSMLRRYQLIDEKDLLELRMDSSAPVQCQEIR